MEPVDLESAERLQVPTGSKRPSPSPSEQEEDRETKRFRTQSFTEDEEHGTQNSELHYPLIQSPYDD